MSLESPNQLNATPAVERARALMEEGPQSRAEARRILEEEIRRNPENEEALDLEVVILHEMGDIATARRLLEEYLRYFPGADLAASRFSWVLWESGEREEALAEAKACLARNRENRVALNWLIDWGFQLEKHDLVAEYATRGLETWPGDSQLSLSLGVAYARQQRHAEARTVLDELISRDPGNEAAARTFAEVLLDQNQPRQAMEALAPFTSRNAAAPITLLRASEAAFRANEHTAAFPLLDRLMGNHVISDDNFLAEVHEVMTRHMGTNGADDYAFGKLKGGEVSDAFAVTMLEAVGGRDNRGRITDVFDAVKNDPLRYPRTVARFLSTYHGAPVMPGAVERWVKSHSAEIEANAIIWGGVGAWLVAKGNWKRAAEHLSRWHNRPGVKPWMLNLLARAHESLGQHGEAINQFRAALLMEPDHTEAIIRSKLAFHLSLEGMPGAGDIIMKDMSEPGKRLGTVEDFLRFFAVQTLVEAQKLNDPSNLMALFEDAMRHMRDLARQDPYANARPILRLFKQRCDQLITLAQARREPEEQ